MHAIDEQRDRTGDPLRDQLRAQEAEDGHEAAHDEEGVPEVDERRHLLGIAREDHERPHGPARRVVERVRDGPVPLPSHQKVERLAGPRGGGRLERRGEGGLERAQG